MKWHPQTPLRPQTRILTHRRCRRVQLCVRSGEEGCFGSRWPGRLLYYFWESCSFPLEGLIEERLALSVSPLSGSGSPAKAQPNRLRQHTTLVESWPMRGPAPTAPCFTQMVTLLTGSRALHFHCCSACESGNPTPTLITGLYCLMLCVFPVSH